MIRTLLSLGGAFGFLLVLQAQPQSTTVSLGTGYSDQVWYSLSQGETGRSAADAWHLAFEVTPMGFSILLNNARGVEGYAYPGSPTDFENLDTIGMQQWRSLINTDTSWSHGALSRYQTGFDIGWGIYNIVTHTIAGDSLFLLKLPSGAYYKLFIEKLVGGTYTFRYATLDNSTDVVETLSKSSFAGKQFGYYNLEAQQSIDREPELDNWDLLFTTYMTEIPTGQGTLAYPVSGVLHKEGIEVAEAYPVPDPANFNDPSGYPYQHEMNTIGYDWKSFAGGWTLKDSLVYFVKLENGPIWKLRFTAFGGSATGDFTFEKSSLFATHTEVAPTVALLQLYPNPAQDVLHMVLHQEGQADWVLQIVNPQGQLVGQEVYHVEGIAVHSLSVSHLPSGIYWLHGQSTTGQFTQSFVKP